MGVCENYSLAGETELNGQTMKCMSRDLNIWFARIYSNYKHNQFPLNVVLIWFVNFMMLVKILWGNSNQCDTEWPTFAGKDV